MYITKPLPPADAETAAKRIGMDHAERYDGGGTNYVAAFGALLAEYANLWRVHEAERAKEKVA